MTHRHHYNYGEPIVTVILIAALAVALAMCRYWCRDAHNERKVFRRAGDRRGGGRTRSRGRRAGVITHHLIVLPANVDIERRSLQSLDFAASAPSYSLVMQNPSVYLHASPRPRAAPLPETPPPPYPSTPSLRSCVVVEAAQEEHGAKIDHV